MYYEEMIDMIDEVYSMWLVEICSDELHTDDQIIEALERRHRWNEFVEWVRING